MKKVLLNIILIFLGVVTLSQTSFAGHKVNTMKIKMTKNDPSAFVTVTNTGGRNEYLTFNVIKREKGKNIDITDKQYFRALPHKIFLEPYEKVRVKISAKNYNSVPKGQYFILFKPQPIKARIKEKGDEKPKAKFFCNVVVQYMIELTVE